MFDAGFNVETITYKGVDFTTWDVGGRSGTVSASIQFSVFHYSILITLLFQRALIRHYYQNTKVLILVVDSNDRERMEECREEVSRFMCEDELRDCCLLVMANKQDLPNAMTVQEITEKLELNKIPPNRLWRKSKVNGLAWMYYMNISLIQPSFSILAYFR